MNTVDTDKLLEVAQRIREMREISGFSPAEMAEKTEVTTEEYISFENGEKDFPFTFIHKCSLVFGIGISDILEGHSAHLSSYTITRKGQGQQTAKEVGIEIQNLAPMFRKKIAEPYYVKYEYSPELQDKPIHTVKHSGQEFDIVLSGRLKVQIGDHIDYLNEGDSIYYNSSSPHGMIAVDGRDCIFVAVVLPGEDEKEEIIRNTLLSKDTTRREMVCSKFIETEEGENGELKSIKFKNEDTFNFAFDIVDEIGRRHPNDRAMLWLDEDENEKEFTFKDMKKLSAQAANYFKALGIKKGDKVMLMLRRRYQFWISILGLHKLGAVAIPATDQLRAHDIEYRFKAADVKAIIVADHGENAAHVEEADRNVPV
ncbi:MAG: AMP-binding protein, partial [Lachnospiraceae bacterium]|nr:AMP-binding protein [Candidatus Minthocola equi]